MQFLVSTIAVINELYLPILVYSFVNHFDIEKKAEIAAFIPFGYPDIAVSFLEMDAA
jgi:hypothetical protein